MEKKIERRIRIQNLFEINVRQRPKLTGEKIPHRTRHTYNVHSNNGRVVVFCAHKEYRLLPSLSWFEKNQKKKHVVYRMRHAAWLHAVCTTRGTE